MSDRTKVVTSQEGAAKAAGGGIAALPGALAQPVARAGRGLYEQVAGGLQWYAEKWEDVVHEAQTARLGAAIIPDVQGVLAGLAQAKAVSECPGRVRLAAAPLKGQDELAYETVQALARLPGIRRVEASPVTGTVLISYNTRTYPSLDALRQKLAER